MRECRLDKAAYFTAAFEVLGETGAEGVTIAALCERLGVTKGSFYHHFADRPAFVREFADRWESGFRDLITGYHGEHDRCARMALAINATAALSHEAEAALRAWGTRDPVIRAAQNNIDALGEEMLLEAVLLFVPDREQAALVTHHGVSLAVGMQHRRRPIDTARYLEVLAQWARHCLGVATETVMTPRGREVRLSEQTTAAGTGPPPPLGHLNSGPRTGPSSSRSSSKFTEPR